MIKKTVRFFDKLENRVRGKLSHYPIFYAIAGGIGVVLFWRGVWHTADDLNISSLFSLALGAFILLITGVFVSAFIGTRLIISGLIGEKKIEEKEQEEIETEEGQLRNLQSTLNRVEKKLDQFEAEIEKK